MPEMSTHKRIGDRPWPSSSGDASAAGGWYIAVGLMAVAEAVKDLAEAVRQPAGTTRTVFSSVANPDDLR